jgi:hypothetical protein
LQPAALDFVAQPQARVGRLKAGLGGELCQLLRGTGGASRPGVTTAQVTTTQASRQAA